MGFDILALIWGAGLVVQLVILLLVVFSAISWAIIIFKWRELSGAAEDSEAFLEVYHEKPLEVAYDAARELDRSPLAMVFLATCAELKLADAGSSDPDVVLLRRVAKKLDWMTEGEVSRISATTTWTATDSSTRWTAASSRRSSARARSPAVLAMTAAVPNVR